MFGGEVSEVERQNRLVGIVVEDISPAEIADKIVQAVQPTLTGD